MNRRRIYLHKPDIDISDEKTVSEALRSGYVAPDGPYNRKFEQSLAAYLKKPYVVSVQSGTAAMHLAIKLAGIGEGDYVLVPTHTFVASVSPLLYEKAVPVFIDSETETYNMSPGYLERAILDLHGKNIRPKAIVVVDMYGLPAKWDELLRIARRYRLTIIEDAAESLGSTYHNKPAGSLGDFGILSFNGNKTVTSSGGGAVIVPTEKTEAKARYLSAHAKEAKPYYFHSETGYNYQMSNLLAALGYAQMQRLDRLIEKKRQIHNSYKKYLAKLPVKILDEQPGSRSNYWLNVMILPENLKPETFIDFMEKHNIETRHIWYPLHKMPLFDSYPYYGNGETEALFNKAVVLPSSPGMTEEETEFVLENIQAFFS